MPWIETHTHLENHPKTLLLQRALGGSLNEALGVLVRFWFWCLQYCEDGQLEKYGSDMIGAALGVDAKHLISAGWIDTEPRFQVHDWWDYTSHYWQSKYKHSPEKWMIIKKFYTQDKERSKNRSNNKTQNKTPNLTNHTNLTKPNQPISTKRSMRVAAPIEIPEDLVSFASEIRDWLEYKRQRGQMYKPKGLEALWRVIRAIPPDRRREAVDHSMANNYAGLFQKNGGINGQQRAYVDSSGGDKPDAGKAGKFSNVGSVLEV